LAGIKRDAALLKWAARPVWLRHTSEELLTGEQQRRHLQRDTAKKRYLRRSSVVYEINKGPERCACGGPPDARRYQ